MSEDFLDSSWRPIALETLAGMEPGEPVVTFTTEWREGRRLYHYHEGTLSRYSPSRGIAAVIVTGKDGWPREIDFCDTSIGRWVFPEVETMHEMTGYDA